MQDVSMTLESNTPLARDIWKMTLHGDCSDIKRPGQFVNLKLDGFFLRRPISVCDVRGDEMTLIYKTVGGGTEQMSRLPAGTELSVLSGLGNGYDTEKSGSRPLLIGGGVGVPPLYMLCRVLRQQGKNVTVLLGFNSREDVFYEAEFAALGARVLTATADGTYGKRGFVTELLPGLDCTYFYACGPMPMFRAVESVITIDGQYSFEERMGCGFGACMGCSCQTKNGTKRICREGPVLERSEIIW